MQYVISTMGRYRGMEGGGRQYVLGGICPRVCVRGGIILCPSGIRYKMKQKQKLQQTI